MARVSADATWYMVIIDPLYLFPLYLKKVHTSSCYNVVVTSYQATLPCQLTSALCQLTKVDGTYSSSTSPLSLFPLLPEQHFSGRAALSAWSYERKGTD